MESGEELDASEKQLKQARVRLAKRREVLADEVKALEVRLL